MKYNLSVIMKRAWDLVKNAGFTISAGLKMAWAEAKSTEDSLRDKVVEQLEYLISRADKVFNYRVRENVWEKYGRSRTYFEIVKTRNHSKHYSTYNFGFIDNVTNEYHAGKNDAFGRYLLSGELI